MQQAADIKIRPGGNEVWVVLPEGTLNLQDQKGEISINKTLDQLWISNECNWVIEVHIRNTYRPMLKHFVMPHTRINIGLIDHPKVTVFHQGR